MGCTTGFVWRVMVVVFVAILAAGCDSQETAAPATSPENESENENESGPPRPPVRSQADEGKTEPAVVAPRTHRSIFKNQDRSPSASNLKTISVALHVYHEKMKAFPAAHNTNLDGEPLLSWRVHILNFLGEEDLYAKFKLDEPWNSPHNQSLIKRMPAVYRSPNSDAESGKTVYLGNATKMPLGSVRYAHIGVFVPPSKPQEEFPRGIRIRDIRDGAHATIAVVEAGDSLAVEWTKPSDYVPSREHPQRGLGFKKDRFLALFCEGSVVMISKDAAKTNTLNALFTRSMAETVGPYRPQ